ncbi:MAG: NADH-quinone oxidoreductase subunit NuoG [Actinomycetes bacterium]
MADTTIDSTEFSVVDGVPVTINGREIIAHKGELIIDAAERNGVYIPRFCYHPRMEPVGMCRMCIVEVDTGRGPTLLPSCMLECTPDMKVDTESEVTTKAQDGVLELLLVNHPLDCPVCDKGGECPLQDQTMAYGPGESRFVEEKRHHEKPIPISDLVLLDRERCILCDRCTRFAKDVAGDPLIHFINRGSETEIATFPDEPFSSYFSGNVVQICPVGALTATNYRFRARPWDLDTVESTCQGCSVGCRVSLDSSRNQLLRYQGVDIDPVNWGWLCDKGRFGFEAVNSPDRLGEPLVRSAGTLQPSGWAGALSASASAIEAALAKSGPSSIAVLGGARLTNESAYAWAKLAKGVIGTDHVDAQLGDGLPADLVLGLPRATIDDVCAPGGTVLVIAADPKEELPVLFLRLRHAVVNDGVKVIEVSPQAGGFTPYATLALHPRPGEAGVAVRALLNGVASGTDAGGVDAPTLAEAAALVASGPITVIIGRQSLAESGEALVDAAAALLAAKPDTRFLPALRRANVNGALDMGLAPGVLPGRVRIEDGRDWFASTWEKVPSAAGLDARGILQAAADGTIEVLVLLGADPVSDFPDSDLARRAIAGAKTIIALDQFLTPSSREADVVFATAGFAEVSGTSTNIEGRVSVLHQKVTGPGTSRPDWAVAADISRRLGIDLGLESITGIAAEIALVAPAYAGVTTDLLHSSEASSGLVVPLVSISSSVTPDVEPDAEPVAEPVSGAEANLEAEEDSQLDGQPEVEAEPAAMAMPSLIRFVAPESVELAPVDSYSLRLVATRKLYDEGTLVGHAPSLASLPPGTNLRVNPYDFDRLGVSGGDQVRVQSSRATLSANIVADRGVPKGSASVVFNQPGIDVGSLIDAAERVTDVRVESEAG